MDHLFSAGKDFLERQNKDDDKEPSGQSLPGGDKAHGGNYPAGGGFLSNLGIDDSVLKTATEMASKKSGSSGDSDLFSSIAASISGKQDQLAQEDIDEEDAVKKHKKEYKDGDGDADEKSLGSAAAVQALKLWNQGEAGDKQDKGSFLGLAMSEASKLFDDKAASGKVASGASKQSTIQEAGEIAMKLYLKSQGQSQGGLAGLASKFL